MDNDIYWEVSIESSQAIRTRATRKALRLLPGIELSELKLKVKPIGKEKRETEKDFGKQGARLQYSVTFNLFSFASS